jgi:large subunit ribosomal protein L18
MKANLIKTARKARRVRRVAIKVRGDAERPRLTVFRSNRYVYAQIIDDVGGRTLCFASSRGHTGPGAANKKSAAGVGKAIGEKARAAGIENVCFDRRGNRYHGRIKALADAARKAGLKF